MTIPCPACHGTGVTPDADLLRDDVPCILCRGGLTVTYDHHNDERKETHREHCRAAALERRQNRSPEQVRRHKGRGYVKLPEGSRKTPYTSAERALIEDRTLTVEQIAERMPGRSLEAIRRQRVAAGIVSHKMYTPEQIAVLLDLSLRPLEAAAILAQMGRPTTNRAVWQWRNNHR